jgi:hypothetical protein
MAKGKVLGVLNNFFSFLFTVVCYKIKQKTSIDFNYTRENNLKGKFWLYGVNPCCSEI